MFYYPLAGRDYQIYTGNNKHQRTKILHEIDEKWEEESNLVLNTTKFHLPHNITKDDEYLKIYTISYSSHPY